MGDKCMRKLFISSLFIFIILAGCSNDEAYNNAIQKGLDYIGSEEYQKAESAFEFALDEKKDDEKATTLLNQVILYQEAVTATEDGELDIAKENAEEVILSEDGSSALIKKAKGIISSINNLEETLMDVTKEHEKASDEFEEENYKEAKKIVETVLERDLEQPIFNSIKKDVKALQKDIKLALDAENKEEEEKVAKEKAELEERKKEQASQKEDSTVSLANYDTKEIEYARILLMTNGVDPNSSVIYVHQYPAGTPVAAGYEETVKYPYAVTYLSGEIGAMGMMVYASHGDGHITIYPQPRKWHQEDQSPEGYRTLA